MRFQPESGCTGSPWPPRFSTTPSNWHRPRAVRIPFDDGSFVLRSPEPLKPYARCVGEWIERWAAETPDALAVAERDASGGWRRLTWRELRRAVGAVAQSLLGLKLPAHRPVVVLSDNSVDHLLLMLGAMHVGRAVCTVSSAYCRLTQDYSKIHGILATLGPALVYAADAKTYGPPVDTSGIDAVVVFSQGAETFPGALAFDSLLRTAESPAVMKAFDAILPDDHAKYLLTSGSTGHPKVVINTHRMLCANMQMMAQVWRFLQHEKPVIVDWLPWSHTFGGNHNLNLVLRHGGTLYVDEGRPAPGLVDKTLRNLREVQPTLWFNVPRGFEMALPALEADEALAREVFARMRMVFYAGAALPQATWARLEAVARRVRPEAPVWFTTSWGSTETSPAITSAHWQLDRAGNIGLPLPGLELKFIPNGQKLELRARGVTIFPGYRNAPHLTAQAFDDEGYYRIGDAGLIADPARPESGVIFDGRVGRGLQADHRHLGERGHAAHQNSQRAGAAGAGRGDHRARPQRGLRAGVPVAAGARAAGRRTAATHRRRAGRPEARRRRQLDGRGPRPCAGRAAQRRRRRDHRQGLHQPGVPCSRAAPPRWRRCTRPPYDAGVIIPT